MNSQKKKLLKEIESKKLKKGIGSKKDDVSKEANPIQQLQELELRSRRITDEFNRIVLSLCSSCATLINENDKLKKQLKGKGNVPEE